MLRVVLIGCGKAAENHIRAIQRLPAVSVVAVCDAEPLMAEQLAVRYGVRKHYSDVDAMLEAERPDVVHIATPPQSHLPLAMTALDAGCHVFVEKPLTLCHADSQRLVTHAISCDRKLTVGYGYYFDPIARTMRNLIADGCWETRCMSRASSGTRCRAHSDHRFSAIADTGSISFRAS